MLSRGLAAILASVPLCVLAQEPATGRAAALETARKAALEFTHSLPEFRCLEMIRRFQCRPGEDNWRQTDGRLARLTYSEKDGESLSVPSDQPSK